MLIPTGGSVSQANDERRDLRVAMRLLAGKDCIRDPKEAQKMLLGIAEGPDKAAATDALTILQKALRNEWLEENIPLFSDLERLAPSSSAGTGQAKEIKLALATGLAVLALLGGVFFAVETDIEIPWILIGVACLILVTGGIALLARRRE